MHGILANIYFLLKRNFFDKIDFHVLAFLDDHIVPWIVKLVSSFVKWNIFELKHPSFRFIFTNKFMRSSN